jgi:hypothetical protein
MSGASWVSYDCLYAVGEHNSFRGDHTVLHWLTV